MKNRRTPPKNTFRIETRSATRLLEPPCGLRVAIEASALKEGGCHVFLPELAPSSSLLDWYGFRAVRYDEFRRRYCHELSTTPHLCGVLRELACVSGLRLIYAAGAARNNIADALGEHLLELECQLRWRSGWMVGGFTYQLRDQILSRGGLWYSRHKVWVMPDALSCREIRSMFPGDF